jgi:membrane associated rhomboid family serine protease
MSKKETLEQASNPLAGGVPTALKLWLFFLFCFFFLGYPVPLSILFGAVGGFAGGWVDAWWNSKDEPSQPKPEEIQDAEVVAASPAKPSGLRRAKLRREARARRGSQRVI